MYSYYSNEEGLYMNRKYTKQTSGSTLSGQSSSSASLPSKPAVSRVRTAAEYFIYFMLYSIIGWIYEVFLEVVVYRWGFSNRGVLFGPYCVIYGFGALILIFSLSWLQKKRIHIGKVLITPLFVFIGIVLITTIVELIGSYIMELTRGEWLWDYTRFAFNFEGRIALNPSIRFGIGGMIFLYGLQPLFRRLCSIYTDRVIYTVSSVLAVILLADVIFTFIL